MTPEPASIVVYTGLDLVGDGLMKLPFLRALRQAYPNATITWLAGKGRTVYAGMLAPLVAGLIDEVIEDAGIGTSWRELLKRPLAGRRFDLVIDTQRRVKTTLILRRIRHGTFVSGAADFRLSDRRPPGAYAKKRRMVEALLDLVAAASGQHARLDVALILDTSYREAASRVLPQARYAGFAPGAGGTHKRWPLERFIALAVALTAEGYTPVFLLGPDEAAWREGLAQSVPGALFPLQTGGDEQLRKSPLFTIAVAERLALAVANDSGTGHMLAAADVRLVSLFGPTDPAKFAPYVTRAAIVRAQDFGGDAMEAIPVEAVLKAALSQ